MHNPDRPCRSFGLIDDRLFPKREDKPKTKPLPSYVLVGVECAAH